MPFFLKDKHMIDNEAFKAAMRLFASGITVITWKTAAAPIQGITVSAFSSLSLNPPLVLFCVDHQAHIYPELSQQQYVCVNILAAGQTALAYQFAGGDRNHLEAHLHHNNALALPMLKQAQANLLINIQNIIRQGDHDIFVGLVEESAVYPERAPLLYYNSNISDGV